MAQLSAARLQKNLLQLRARRELVVSHHTSACSISPAWDFSPSLPVVRAHRCSKGIILGFVSTPFSLTFSPRECLSKC